MTLLALIVTLFALILYFGATEWDDELDDEYEHEYEHEYEQWKQHEQEK